MPLYAVHALDKPDCLTTRLELAGAHRGFIGQEAEYRLKVIMAGPLQSVDGETMIGSLFILEAPDHETVEAFTRGCPFYGVVWSDVKINRFTRRVG